MSNNTKKINQFVLHPKYKNWKMANEGKKTIEQKSSHWTSSETRAARVCHRRALATATAFELLPPPPMARSGEEEARSGHRQWLGWVVAAAHHHLPRLDPVSLKPDLVRSGAALAPGQGGKELIVGRVRAPVRGGQGRVVTPVGMGREGERRRRWGEMAHDIEWRRWWGDREGEHQMGRGSPSWLVRVGEGEKWI
jgi:hypothetical protein